MAKINSKALDPQRYACIQAEQRELEQQYSPISPWHGFARIVSCGLKRSAKGPTARHT